MKLFIMLAMLFLTTCVLAGECQVIARSDNGSGAFRTPVEKTKNLSSCLASASVIGEGWHNAMLKYTDSKGKVLILKIKRRTSLDFSDYARNGDAVDN